MWIKTPNVNWLRLSNLVQNMFFTCDVFKILFYLVKANLLLLQILVLLNLAIQIITSLNSLTKE